MENFKKWYVYTLIDPRDGSIFYVGKGQRNRMYIHVWSTKKGNPPHKNYKLFRRIREIINENLNVLYDKPFSTDIEKEAYEYEYNLIKKIGLEFLCNLFEGYGKSYSGENHWNYGKHLTNEVKEKISKSKIGDFHSDNDKNKMKEFWSKNTHPLKGKNHSTETKQKMSENHSNFNGEKNPFYGKSHNVTTKKYLSDLNSILWTISFMDGTEITLKGKKAVYKFIQEYNERNKSKISSHSIFQYKKNKEGWSIRRN
jgi:hypothetical protein